MTDLPPLDDNLPPSEEPVDLHKLVGQFTALRQEVNLQTKASRVSLEQNAKALEHLEEVIAGLREPPPEEPAGSREELKPLFKAIIDVYDALALAYRQVEKQKTSIAAALETASQTVEITAPPKPAAIEARSGFWAWFLGRSEPNSNAAEVLEWYGRTTRILKDREQKARESCDYLTNVVDSLMTGYAMSLSRIDRVLAKFGLEPIKCAGVKFDPEMMEVVEAVPNTGRSPGEVIEEVRRGYLLDDAVFRYAQVRVAT